MEIVDRIINELLQSIEEIDYVKFIFNLLVTGLLAGALQWFYIRFGNAVSNRRRFSRTFLPLAMTTMVIIFIVKSSVALSLGLVGALSIVRFRSAIKDPEELTYLFLTIGLGLAAGADEILIAAVAFVFILGILFLQAFLRQRGLFRYSDSLYLNYSTKIQDSLLVINTLKGTLPYVDMKRLDQSGQRLNFSFHIEVANMDQVEDLRKKLLELDPEASISFIEQRNLAV